MFKLPDVSLNHLRTLTDDTGIIQHGFYSLPNRKTGYCVDDNARALIVAAMYYEQFNEPSALELLNVYLSFLHYAQKDDGWFHNFVDYQRHFLDEEGSPDSFSRALWACGQIANSHFLSEQIRVVAQEILEQALKHIPNLQACRAQAFAIIGLNHYWQVNPEKNKVRQMIAQLAERLMAAYHNSSSDQWDWFEDRLTYCNGRLPQAMYLAYYATQDERYLEVAEKTLAFLSRVVIKDNQLCLVGNRGWYFRGGQSALFDQQPVDAAAMVDVYSIAHQVTANRIYYYWAVLAFEWFTGRNILKLPVYDPTNGGCYDGLTPNGVNKNQGAESTVSCLLANLTLRKIVIQTVDHRHQTLDSCKLPVARNSQLETRKVWGLKSEI